MQTALDTTPADSHSHTPALNDLQRQQLENEITELAAHIHAATYQLLELIRRFDEGGGWHGDGLRSCAHWLNWKCGIALGAAREKLRVAKALADLPQTSKQFARGEISYSKVRAMTRVATAENESFLLMIARHGTASHMERLVSQYRRVKRIEALEKDQQQHAMRECSWYFDEQGMWVCRVKLDAEQGALVEAQLEAALEALTVEQRDCPETAEEESTGDELKPTTTPVAQRRADAVVRLALGKSGSKGGDSHLVNVHACMDTLREDGTSASSEQEGCGHVSAETSRRLACDAGVVHWLEDSQGNTLNIGRKSRSVPPALRRALKRRDGGCQFPGCTCTRFVDAHHIQHWADGGETSLDNLVLLCRHHHRLVHEGGYEVNRCADGELVFRKPDGEVLPFNGETRLRGDAQQLKLVNREIKPDIGPHTGACLWLGERMDSDMAISGI